MWNVSLAYWEPRRLVYNAILLVVVITQLSSLKAWPQLFTAKALWGMVLAAGLANLCYTSAHAVDLAIQCSDFRDYWLKRRHWLLAAGTLFAASLATFSVGEILKGIFG